MSAIRDGRIPIELDKRRHMLFSLNVIDEVEDKIGDISDLDQAMNDKGRMKFIKWLFTLLLNEGAEDGEEQLTEMQVGKLIHSGNFNEIQTAILGAFRYGNKGTTEPPPESEAGADDDSETGNAQPGEEG